MASQAVKNNTEIEKLKIENSDLRATLDQITLLQSLIREINRCNNSNEIVQTVLQIIPQFVECLSCQIFLYRGDRFRKLGEKDFVAGIPMLKVSDETIYWACKRGTVVVLPGEATGHGQAIVPMNDGTQIVGAILLDLGKFFENYSETTTILLSTMADHMGLALSHNINLEKLGKEVEEHAEVREYFDRVIASIGHPIISMDSDGNITLFNPPAEDFFEIRERIAVGNPYTLVFAEDVSQCIGECLHSIQHRQTPQPREINFLTPFKTTRLMRLTAAPLRARSNGKSGMVCVCEDLSLSRELERQKEVNRQKNDFFTMVTRELEKPIQEAIDINAGGHTALSAEHTTVMGQKLHHIEQVISDVLDLTKLEMDQLPFESEIFELDSILDDVYDKYHLRASHRGIHFTLNKEARGFKVKGDRNRLKQVIQNIASNALKYTPEGGRVVLGLSYKTGEHGEFAEVYAEDSGIGIAPHDIERIFDRYTRAKETAHLGGLGLGLPLSQEILKRFQSTMQVKSTPGQGSTFYFHLVPHLV